MLKVTIELYPFGSATQAKKLKEVYIGNVGVEREDKVLLDVKCTYHVWEDYNPAGILAHARKKPDAVVSHWRSQGAEVLVAKALDKIHG